MRATPTPPRRLAAAVFLAAAVGCGGNHVTPPTPPAPEITCPSGITVNSVTGGSQSVSFPAPTVANGSPPVTATCTRESGSTFALGSTTVTCVAADQIGRQATCSFTVTLNAVVLAVKRFVAFGDSLTIGENGLFTAFGRPFVDTPNSYPAKLEALFAQEFPDQGIVVINEGKGGERVEDAVRRLPDRLAADRPDALLLLDGYNNLRAVCPFGTPIDSACRSEIEFVVGKMREAVRAGRASPTVRYVFVSTLTPPGPLVDPFHDRRISLDAILEVNKGLRRWMPEEGAVLVDSFPLFLGHEAEYVNDDGLHLRPEGYQVLAETFFAAIKQAIPASFGR